MFSLAAYIFIFLLRVLCWLFLFPYCSFLDSKIHSALMQQQCKIFGPDIFHYFKSQIQHVKKNGRCVHMCAFCMAVPLLGDDPGVNPGPLLLQISIQIKQGLHRVTLFSDNKFWLKSFKQWSGAWDVHEITDNLAFPSQTNFCDWKIS